MLLWHWGKKRPLVYTGCTNTEICSLNRTEHCVCVFVCQHTYWQARTHTAHLWPLRQVKVVTGRKDDRLNERLHSQDFFFSLNQTFLSEGELLCCLTTNIRQKSNLFSLNHLSNSLTLHTNSGFWFKKGLCWKAFFTFSLAVRGRRGPTLTLSRAEAPGRDPPTSQHSLQWIYVY